MLIQVIHCHPLTDSYNHALFKTIVGALEKSGHQVVATDLYRESFQPVMTEQERRSYLGMDYDGHAVAGYIDTLKRIDGIVFCFPHWWFAMPAVLKGYVDRVWAPGAAFKYKAGGLEPNLRNIKLFGVVTSYGSPWWHVCLLAGDPGRKVMMRGMKILCARDVRSIYLAHYDMDHSTPASRKTFLEKVDTRFSSV